MKVSFLCCGQSCHPPAGSPREHDLRGLRVGEYGRGAAMSVCMPVNSMTCPRALLRGTSLHASAARAATPAVVHCRLWVPISATGRIQVRPACAHHRPRSPGAATRLDPVRHAPFWAAAQHDCVYDRCRPWTDTFVGTLRDRCIAHRDPAASAWRRQGPHLGHLALVEAPSPKRHAGSSGCLNEHHIWVCRGPPKLQQQLMRAGWYDALGRVTSPAVLQAVGTDDAYDVVRR